MKIKESEIRVFTPYQRTEKAVKHEIPIVIGALGMVSKSVSKDESRLSKSQHLEYAEVSET